MDFNVDPLEKLQADLTHHPLYERLRTLESLRIFMKYHVFVVWDFMSLLKSLQRALTGLALPWRPSPHEPRLVRLINEIVLGEESDLDSSGRPCSHFELYLRAMEEVGADTAFIKTFLAEQAFSRLPPTLQDVVSYHLNLATNGAPYEVAAAFFYGREQLIPTMFDPMLRTLRKAGLPCPTLNYYLERHIQVDGESHGPLALECLQVLCDSAQKGSHSRAIALESLAKRLVLWDFVLKEVTSR